MQGLKDPSVQRCHCCSTGQTQDPPSHFPLLGAASTPGGLYKPKRTSGVTSSTDQETEMKICFPDTTSCSRKGNQLLQLHDYVSKLN